MIDKRERKVSEERGKRGKRGRKGRRGKRRRRGKEREEREEKGEREEWEEREELVAALYDECAQLWGVSLSADHEWTRGAKANAMRVRAVA